MKHFRLSFGSAIVIFFNALAAGCHTAPNTVPLSSGYLLVPSLGGNLEVGQLIDDGFSTIHSHRSKHWDYDTATGVESVSINLGQSGNLEGFLSLLGAKTDLLSEKAVSIAAQHLKHESVSIEFTDASITTLAVEEVNQMPRAAFIRRDYDRLEEAFRPGSGVNLIVSALSANEFRLKTSLSAKSAAKLNEMFKLSSDWQKSTWQRVKAPGNAKVVVAIRFASPTMRFAPTHSKSDAPGTNGPTSQAKLISTSLHDLLGTTRVNLPMTDHGLHNSGPYHGSASAKLVETREGGMRRLTLHLSGSVANLGCGSPCDGGLEILLKEFPARWVVEINPQSAREFEVIQKYTGNYAGLRLHGQETSSSLVSNVEIICNSSFFAFHPLPIVFYTD